MKERQSQAHVKWECKYHVVIVPKYRKKAIFGKLRQQIGEMLRPRARRTSEAERTGWFDIRLVTRWPLLGAFLIPPVPPVVLIVNVGADGRNPLEETVRHFFHPHGFSMV